MAIPAKLVGEAGGGRRGDSTDIQHLRLTCHIKDIFLPKQVFVLVGLESHSWICSCPPSSSYLLYFPPMARLYYPAPTLLPGTFI